MRKSRLPKRIQVKQISPFVFSRNSFLPDFTAEHCKNIHCQRFLSTHFSLWLRETPRKSSLWAVFASGGFLTECANNRNHSWLWYRPSRMCKMPRATQWSCLSKPAGRHHMSHMETAKMGSKAAGSEATSFACHGRISNSLWCKAFLPLKCPISMKYHQSMVIYQIEFKYILPISFLFLWLVPEITTIWKKKM